MQLRTLIQTAFLCAAQLSHAVCSSFPSDLGASITNLETYIENVITDLKNKDYDVVANDYSSTGRSLAFLEEDAIQRICTYDLATSASTEEQAVAYLRYVPTDGPDQSFCSQTCLPPSISLRVCTMY
jgi:hypothetical protein